MISAACAACSVDTSWGRVRRKNHMQVTAPETAELWARRSGGVCLVRCLTRCALSFGACCKRR